MDYGIRSQCAATTHMHRRLAAEGTTEEMSVETFPAKHSRDDAHVT